MTKNNENLPIPAEQPTKNNGLTDWIISSAKVLHLPFGIGQKEILIAVNEWISTLNSFQISRLQENELHVIQYRENKGFKSTLGLSAVYHLYVIVTENKLYYLVREAEWANELQQIDIEQKKHFAGLLSDSREGEIEEIISEHILKPFSEHKINTLVKSTARHIEIGDETEQIWLISFLEKTEILLAFLEISEIRKAKNIVLCDKNLHWHFLLTNKRSFLVAKNKRNEFVHIIDTADNAMEVKSELGRDPVIIADIDALTTRANEILFHEIKTCINLHNRIRIREVARFNWNNTSESETFRSFAYQLLLHLIIENEDPFDELSLLFVGMDEEQSETSKQVFEERLPEALKTILSLPNAGQKLIEWANRWKISHVDSLALVRVFLSLNAPSQLLKNAMSFHEKIRSEFYKNNKDEITRTAFDLQYSRYLIDSGLHENATSILETRLKHLPDETLSDLLPPKNLAPTSKDSGQMLRITLYELLAEARQTGDSTERIEQLACLQPLVTERIEMLAETPDSELRQRAQDVRMILRSDGIKTVKSSVSVSRFNRLKNKFIKNKLQHPAARKGGVFQSVQSWLAKIEIPDHSAIRSYSEKISVDKYPQITDVMTDIKHIFGIEGVDIFAVRGEKNIGVHSFEGKEAFLTIGHKHLDENSIVFLRTPELRFSMGVEVAHLYFKHSRITASDVWKGARQKSMFVIDTLLTVLPFISGLKAVKSLYKFRALAALITRSQKAKEITEATKSVLDVAIHATATYNNFTKQEKSGSKEDQLLATSRVMQLTADRAGLLICGDLNAAVRAMFFESESYARELSVCEKYGLTDFLLRQDEAGNYTHQDFAVRIAAMFSFYLSKDYEILRSEIIKITK